MNNLFSKAISAKNTISKIRSQAPDFQLWKSIEAQLNFIISDFSDSGVFLNQADKDRVSQIIMGLQAVREIESSDPQLADLLCEIDYEYKSFYSIGS